MKKTNLLIVLSIIISFKTFALECPNISSAPPCPTSGVRLLDESYPTQAFVVSNVMKSGFVSKTSRVPEDFTMNVIESYDYENIPQIIFPFTDIKDYEELKKKVEANLVEKKIAKEKIDKILAQMTHAPTESYTWQQDYFISEFNPQSGRPVLSNFDSYGQKFYSAEHSTNALVAGGNQCGVERGQVLKESADSFGSGEMGGNTQALPGGYCLTGDNQGIDLSVKFCGSKENVVQVNTSWQRVGHVDEIFKIIPTNYADGRPRECQFSFLAASPRKALELLIAEKNADKKMFDFDPKLSQEQLEKERILKSRNNNLCQYIKNSAQKRENNKTNSELDSAAKNVFMRFFIEKAFAGVTRTNKSTANLKSIQMHGYNFDYDADCEKGISDLTNREYYNEFMNDNDAVELNNLVQESIDRDKEKVKKSILARLPQCEKYFEMTDVPDLFYGGGNDVYTDADGKRKLASPGNVRSLLPNPTNSVVMNHTLLIPESNNNTFNDYINEELKKKRMKTSYIDVWEFAHMLDGNMHCSSHSINYCSPVAQKR